MSFCAAALFAAAPLSAAPVRPAMHALNAEERLVVWLASNPSVRQKLGHIQAVAAPFADPSLKDAVADQPAIVKAAPRIGYCTACYTGNYPTEWVDAKDILPATVSL